MQSFCFEIKSTCKNCGNPLSINAFVNDIFCESCNNKNEISQQNWKSIVSENIDEARDFKEGEGQNSKTFTGEFEFSLLFGKQKARCAKCKTAVPEDVFESFTGENYTCAKCSNTISVRKPNEFNLQVLPFVKYIAGEDINQFNTNVEGIKKPDEIRPVIFNCPSCAANLEVDGSSRTITCKSCNSKVYLPDDLWHELHPVKTVNRWYIILDESKIKEKLPDWYHLSDVATDFNGNIYVACADSLHNNFILWSADADLKLRWIRNDFQYDYENTGLSVTKDNKLLLWNTRKRSLNIFSCEDGKDLPGIKGADESKENPYPFTLKDCSTLISDSDNTILAVVNNKFVRFYNDGNRAPVWKVGVQKGEKPGFFSRLFGGGNTEVNISSEDYGTPPAVTEIGDTPKRVVGNYITMNTGHDGYVYMLDTDSDEGVLLKYSRDGNCEWRKLVPLKKREGKPCADKNGNVYVLGSDDKDKTKLIRFSPGGDKIDVILNDVVDGGQLSTQDMLTVAPDGTIFTFKYYGVLKVFSPDLNCKFESEKSKEEAEEKIEEFKEQKNKDD